MKKVLILFFALTTALSMNVLAQATVTIGNAAGTVGTTVSVPVTVNFSGISGGAGAFDFYIDFDAANIVFQGITGAALSGVNASIPFPLTQPGRLLIAWSSLTSSNLNGQLLNIQFSSNNVGAYPLTFHVSPAPGSFVSDNTATPVASTLNNGSVTFNAAVPLSNWAIFIGLGLIVAFLVVRFRKLV